MAERLTFDVFSVDNASRGFVSAGKSASAASDNVAALSKRLDEIGKRSVEARVGLAGDKGALAQLDQIQVKLLATGKKTADPKITLEGYAKASAQASLLDAQLGKLSRQADDVGGEVVGLGSDLGSLSNLGLPAAIAAGVALSPVLVTLGAGMTGFGAAAVGVLGPIEKASQATGGLKANMGTLSPLQQDLATEVLGLGKEYSAFEKSLQPEIVSVFSTAVKIGGAIMHDVQPVAAATGQVFGQFLSQFGATLQDPEWKQFWSFMATTAPVDMQLLGSDVIILANDIPKFTEALQPAAEGLLRVTGWLLQGAGAAAQFGGALTSLSGDMKPPGGGIVVWLEDSYIKTVRQAEDWTGKLFSWIPGMGTASAKAAPQVAQASVQVSLLAQAEQSAAAQTKILTGDWATLLGLFSSQQDILNADQAVTQFAKDVKKSGDNSQVAQGDFLAAATAIAQMGQGLQKAHAPASALYADLEKQITALGKAGPLTQQEKADLNQLQGAATAAANSTQGWNKWTLQVAQSLENTLIPQLRTMKVDTPQVRTDIADLTNAIINTGTKSAATRSDRQKLIADLENAGVNARTATGLVDGLERKIAALKGKTVNVGVHGAGSGGVQFTESQSVEGGKGHGALFFKAAGGRIPGWGGGDTVPAMLERGETVVPKHLTPAVAPLMKAHGVPGFAAGGIAGQLGAMVPFASGAAGGFASQAVAGFASAAVSASLAQLKQAVAAGAAIGALAGVGGGVGKWASTASGVLRMLEGSGQRSGDLGIVLSQMTTESGGNPYAVNKTDSNWLAGHPSVGLMQVIRGTFGAYAGPFRNTGPFEYGVSVNPEANIYAGMNYAIARYGPGWRSVLGHGHGYDQGGWLPTGVSLAVNNTGQPERVLSPAQGGGGNTYNIHIAPTPLARPGDIGREVVGAIRAFEKQSGAGWRK